MGQTPNTDTDDRSQNTATGIDVLDTPLELERAFHGIEGHGNNVEIEIADPLDSDDLTLDARYFGTFVELSTHFDYGAYRCHQTKSVPVEEMRRFIKEVAPMLDLEVTEQ